MAYTSTSGQSGSKPEAGMAVVHIRMPAELQTMPDALLDWTTPYFKAI